MSATKKEVLKCAFWAMALLAALFGLAAACSAAPVLYDFYADWCGPCQSMTATVDSLVAEGYAVQRVNIDRQPELAAKYSVQSIPCFVWLESGREVDRIIGITTKERLKWHGAPVVKERERVGVPHPAWHYDKVRPSVVRIVCREVEAITKGSGVVVRWGRQVVILTARHVVKDAKDVRVRLSTGTTIRVRVAKMDPAWDCAVLIPLDPIDVQPAEFAWGVAAKFSDGDRLESCGFGPDDKFAVNSGLFKGYRRSTRNIKTGPDDWFILSGHARPGDSGGPVFDTKGRVAGILWGTDGEEVVCVQPGRLHLVLNETFKTHQSREPTPPMPGPVDEDDGWYPAQPRAACGPGCDCEKSAVGGQKRPILPGNRALQEDKRIEQEIAALRAEIAALAQKPQAGTDPSLIAAIQQQQARIDALEQAKGKDAAKPAEKSPGNKLEQKLDDFLHKLPIQGPITKLEEKQLESEHPLQRFFGANTAIVLLTLVGVGLLLGVVLVLHAIYKAAHAHIAAITAKEAAIPVVGKYLAAGTAALDTFNTNQVDPKLTGLLDGLHAKLTALEAKVAPPAATPPATPAVVINTPAATATK